MKHILNSIIYTLLLSAALPALANRTPEHDGVKIRVHVPYSERLENERFHHMLVRIENSSGQPLILITEGDDSIAGLAQFASQSRDDAKAGNSPNFSSWEQVERIADLTIHHGQAIEMIGGSAMGVSFPPDGEYRLAFQVGPDEVVFSNFVTLTTIPSLDTSNWTVISKVQIAPGEMGINEFILGETASGKWLFRRPVWNRSILHRVCHIPDDTVPEIVEDLERFQVIIRNGGKDNQSVYLSGALGVTKSTPWPHRHRGADFINNPLPINAPSPLEFPSDLFDEEIDTTDMDSSHDKASSSIPESVGVDGDNKDQNKSSRRAWYLILFSILVLSLFFAFRKLIWKS